QRQVEAGGHEALAEEGIRFLVVHLPVAAVDVDECRRGGRSAGADVESVTCAVAIAQIDARAGHLAHRVAASGPPGDVVISLRLADGGGVVVGGVEHRTVHTPIEHQSSSYAVKPVFAYFVSRY